VPDSARRLRPSADLLQVCAEHEYPLHDDPSTPQNERQTSIDNTRSFKPSGTPLVVEETFVCFNGASSDDVERFVSGSSTLANGSVDRSTRSATPAATRRRRAPAESARRLAGDVPAARHAPLAMLELSAY
jgi:hypothetical protein